jgi:hypothetical protein
MCIVLAIMLAHKHCINIIDHIHKILNFSFLYFKVTGLLDLLVPPVLKKLSTGVSTLHLRLDPMVAT